MAQVKVGQVYARRWKDLEGEWQVYKIVEVPWKNTTTFVAYFKSPTRPDYDTWTHVDSIDIHWYLLRDSVSWKNKEKRICTK
jgi:hypothetical protein